MNVLKNGFFYGAGLAMLTLASLRHRIGGYRNPTDFSPSDWPRSIGHVLLIVQDWQGALASREGGQGGFAGRDVLELGPGATLGTGILLAGLGCRSYQAVDLFPLARGTPAGFYAALAGSDLPPGFDRTQVRAAVAALGRGEDRPVAYATDPDFDIVRAVEGRTFDVIVSNAAFEHFVDIAAVIAQVGTVARPGALFIAMVDFQTHSRWIREADPNGIYRYGPALYGALSFPGQPNRRRPGDYLEALARHGWESSEVRSVDVGDADYLAWSAAGLDRAFAGTGARMEVLTGAVLARKA